MDVKLTMDIGTHLFKLGTRLMDSLADFTSRFDALDASVAAIAGDVADLKTKAADSGLTAAEEATVLALTDAVGTALDAIKASIAPTPPA